MPPKEVLAADANSTTAEDLAAQGRIGLARSSSSQAEKARLRTVEGKPRRRDAALRSGLLGDRPH